MLRNNLFYSIVFMFAACLNAEKVLLVTGDWYPYTIENSLNKGAFTEIVSAVFTEMKVEFQIEFYPWKRAEMMVENGVAWAVFPYKTTPERKLVFNFSDQIMNGTGRLFYYKPSNKVKIADWIDFADLKGFKIGGVLGYWYEYDFKKAGLDVSYVVSDEINFRRLEKKIVDLVAADELVGRAIIQKYFPEHQDDFLVLPKETDVSSLHLMISRNYRDSEILTAKFNTSLKKLKESGLYAKILAKYGIKK